MVKDMLLIKGAPEIIIERCKMLKMNGKFNELTKDNKNEILEDT